MQRCFIEQFGGIVDDESSVECNNQCVSPGCGLLIGENTQEFINCLVDADGCGPVCLG